MRCADNDFSSRRSFQKRNGTIKDDQWHRSFVSNAIDNQRDVIPMYIHAQNSKRFYRIGKLREKLGLNLNLELFLLSDEMFRQKNKTIQIVIGKPIPYTSFDQSKSHYEWSQQTKEVLYKLANKVEPIE